MDRVVIYVRYSSSEEKVESNKATGDERYPSQTLCKIMGILGTATNNGSINTT